MTDSISSPTDSSPSPGGTSRRRIAIVGHSCSPALGSEPSFTWNWAKQLSQWYDVHTFTHPHYRDHVDRELAERPLDNLTIHWVEVQAGKDPWKPAEGERGIRRHYRLWQKVALEKLQALHKQLNFDLVHHVSWASLNQPPLAWKLGIPFVWGPIGGGQTWPKAFLRYATAGKKEEYLRKFATTIAPWNPAIRSAARASSIVFANNDETAAIVSRAGAPRVKVLLDGGVFANGLAPAPRTQTRRDGMTMLWAGRLEPRKGLPLALEALQFVKHAGVKLLVAGKGDMRAEWVNLAKSLNVAERVEFLGAVPFAQMQQRFAEADALLFTSLRDSTGTVVLEAMGLGLPCIILDHQGVKHWVAEDSGVKVPVTTPGQTVAALAAAIEWLAGNPDLRLAMGKRSWEIAQTHTWESRGRWMHDCYENILTGAAAPIAGS